MSESSMMRVPSSEARLRSAALVRVRGRGRVRVRVRVRVGVRVSVRVMVRVRVLQIVEAPSRPSRGARISRLQEALLERLLAGGGGAHLVWGDVGRYGEMWGDMAR